MIHWLHNNTAEQRALVVCQITHSVNLGHLDCFPSIDRELLICLRHNESDLLHSRETPKSDNIDEDKAVGVFAALRLQFEFLHLNPLID